MEIKNLKHVSTEVITGKNSHTGTSLEGHTPDEITMMIQVKNSRYNQQYQVSIEEILDLAYSMVMAVEGWQYTAEEIHLIQDYPWQKRIDDIKKKIAFIRRKN